jgi:acetolactate synthase-1/3 small subunit
MQEKFVLTILMQNKPGVLARLSSLFGRRAYNIESITVSTTLDSGVSRMTMAVTGDGAILPQIIQQTKKLEEIIDVFAMNSENSLYRELLLIKLEADETTRSAIREICEIYKAKIIDLSVSTMVIELTGTPQKVDAFMEVIGVYPIVELCRTGATGIERGIPANYQFAKTKI